MPAKKTDLRLAAARAGAAKRWHPENAEPARELATERIHSYIERVLSDAPPLSPDQKARITALLQSGSRE